MVAETSEDVVEFNDDNDVAAPVTPQKEAEDHVIFSKVTPIEQGNTAVIDSNPFFAKQKQVQEERISKKEQAAKTTVAKMREDAKAYKDKFNQERSERIAKQAQAAKYVKNC